MGEQEKLETMKDKGKTGKVKRIEERTVWQTAIDKAEGVKVKDDVELLKKALKRQEQKKKSSKRKWDDRVEGTEQKKKLAQAKRAESIAKKKAKNKETKKKKAIKKGRLIPGL